MEGLVRKFLAENSETWKKNFCVYIMPMANKDGVFRGMTRFNVRGMDTNRNWDSMSDPYLCPEKYALEKFIEDMISDGIKPELGIDIHNDDSGEIDFSMHPGSDTLFRFKADLLEKLMRAHTCFTEKAGITWETPGVTSQFVMFEDGLFRRFGIESFVWELNANWVGTRKTMPVAADWINSGKGLNEVFFGYFSRIDLNQAGQRKK